MSRALIIVAHGSSVKPATAQTVVHAGHRLAKRPEISQRFERVEVRFLKQEPLLSETDWGADEIVVIPYFMADGYFVNTVLPRHLPEDARLTLPLGAADLSDVVIDAVTQFDPTAHLVLVGHGTERNPDSARTVEALAERVRTRLRSVTTAFVDQEPALETTWQRVPDDGHAVVVVPYFAFPGPHTEDDIPNGLSIAAVSEQQAHGRTVYYAPPVGAAPGIVDVLVALATS